MPTPSGPCSSFSRKDVRLPAGLQHSLAVEAEAQRQARVRVSRPGAGRPPAGAVFWGNVGKSRRPAHVKHLPCTCSFPHLPVRGGIWLCYLFPTPYPSPTAPPTRHTHTPDPIKMTDSSISPSPVSFSLPLPQSVSPHPSLFSGAGIFAG